MRANLVITGFVESQGENCVEVVQNFFHKNLKITEEIRVDKAFRTGKGDQRAMIVVLNDPSSKKKHISKHKEFEGSKECIWQEILRR